MPCPNVHDSWLHPRKVMPPKKSHADVTKCIGRYLNGTKDKGMILHPDHTKSFDCWVDANFSGNWRPEQLTVIQP